MLCAYNKGARAVGPDLVVRLQRVVERELLAVNDVSTLLVDLSGMLKDIGFKS